jgi:hypothetical protein
MDEFEKHVREGLFPKIDGSAVFVSICPIRENNTPDVKFCVELGAAIMYDKPIVAIAPVGWTIPGKLQAVADHIITADIATQAGRERVTKELDRILREFPDDRPEWRTETPPRSS